MRLGFGIFLLILGLWFLLVTIIMATRGTRRFPHSPIHSIVWGLVFSAAVIGVGIFLIWG